MAEGGETQHSGNRTQRLHCAAESSLSLPDPPLCLILTTGWLFFFSVFKKEYTPLLKETVPSGP